MEAVAKCVVFGLCRCRMWGIGSWGCGVALTFKSVDREQQFLLPPDVREWLPSEHLVWMVLESVEQLDLSGFERSYRLGRQGRAAYHPAMMVALLLYAYAVGVRSSRQIERACETDVAFRVIAANERPDHATIARFRAAHGGALEAVFAQVVGLCVGAGMVDARVLAVDSTKIAANASGARNLTREQLEELARQVFEEAACLDAAEDERFGSDRRGDEPAPGWEPGPGRAARIRQALAQIDEQSDRQAEIEQRQQERERQGKKRRGRKPLPADPNKPWRVASRQKSSPRRANLTDPDSRMMKTPKGFAQSYTAQAVTTAGQIIVAVDVTNDQNDNQALRPMIEQAVDILTVDGAANQVQVALADSGYWNLQEIETIEKRMGIATLVATVRDRDLRAGVGKPDRPSLQRMHQRFQHPSARRIYKRRSTMIEPVFGQRKENHRLTRFLRRGLDAVKTEWILEATAHNLTKMWRARLAATAG
jgi:transposase